MLSEIDDKARMDIKKHNIFLSVYTITTPEGFMHAIAEGAKAVVTIFLRNWPFIAIHSNRHERR